MSALQTLCYKYGLLPPAENAELVWKQLWLSHQYRNKLVEVERNRRERYTEILRTLDPAVAELAEEIAELERALEARREELQRQRSGKKRKHQDIDGGASVNVLRRELQKARKALKSAQAAAKKKPEIKEALDDLRSAFKEESKEAYRDAGEEGLYWGSRGVWNRVAREQFGKGPPPRFRRWDGSLLAVQLQTEGERNGYGWEALLGNGEEADAARRLIQVDVGAIADRPKRSDKAPKYRPHKDSAALLRVRVGSNPDRTPVFATFRLYLHRPLPTGARVKWVKVVARRVGTHMRWSAHFEFQMPEEWVSDVSAQANSGAVALDLNWRQLILRGDGEDSMTLRAGGWAGEDGRTGDIVLPPSVRQRLAKSSDLKAIRQQRFDAVKEALTTALKCVKLSPEHKERTQHLPRWRSPGRLASLAFWWRENRINDDGRVFALLENWRRRDKHLWDWEANNRRRALAHRKHVYREIAAQLARDYSTLLVEDIDLSRIAQRPAPEDPAYEDRSDRAESQRTEVAPSDLRDAMIRAFRARGGQVVEVAPAGSAREILDAYVQTGGARRRRKQALGGQR